MSPRTSANGPEIIHAEHVLAALHDGPAMVTQIAKRIRPIGWSHEDEEMIQWHLGRLRAEGRVRPDGAHYRLTGP